MNKASVYRKTPIPNFKRNKLPAIILTVFTIILVLAISPDLKAQDLENQLRFIEENLATVQGKKTEYEQKLIRNAE